MLLSIITINRNNLAGLRETTESVLKQTDQDFEWIVVDGASTDGGAEFTRAISRPNTIAFSEPDKGIYDAMNKGIDLCHGDYCLFLNSGDCFHQKDSVARCLSEIRNSPECDIFRFALAITLNSRIKEIIHPVKKITGIFLYSTSIPHQATVIRTSWLRKYHYDTKYRIAADLDFFRKVYFFEGIKDAAIDFILSNYDGSGISSVNPTMLREEKEKAFQNLMGPLIYEDYHRFLYGDSISDKFAARIRRNPLFAKIAVLILSPLYLLWWFFIDKRKIEFFQPLINYLFKKKR